MVKKSHPQREYISNNLTFSVIQWSTYKANIAYPHNIMRNAIESEAVLAEILATADAEVHGMRNYETPCYCTFNIVGPSGVRALPLAAGINEGDHYFRC